MNEPIAMVVSVFGDVADGDCCLTDKVALSVVFVVELAVGDDLIVAADLVPATDAISVGVVRILLVGLPRVVRRHELAGQVVSVGGALAVVLKSRQLVRQIADEVVIGQHRIHCIAMRQVGQAVRRIVGERRPSDQGRVGDAGITARPGAAKESFAVFPKGIIVFG